MYKYKLLLLDLDGTLLDFHVCEDAALRKTFTQFNIEHSKNNVNLYLKANASVWKELEEGLISADDLSNERFRRFLMNLKHNLSQAEAMSDFFLARLGEGKDLLPNALEFLQSVAEKHHIAYLTNGLTCVQKNRLNGNPITPFASLILISQEAGKAKPHPLMVQKAMAHFNITNPKEVLMIGDSVSSDIGAAVASGVDSVFIGQYTCPKATYSVRSIQEVEPIANIKN